MPGILFRALKARKRRKPLTDKSERSSAPSDHRVVSNIGQRCPPSAVGKVSIISTSHDNFIVNGSRRAVLDVVEPKVPVLCLGVQSNSVCSPGKVGKVTEHPVVLNVLKRVRPFHHPAVEYAFPVRIRNARRVDLEGGGALDASGIPYISCWHWLMLREELEAHL